MTNYKKLFKEKTHSMRIEIGKEDLETGNRIGGYAPAYFDEVEIEKNGLNNYLYFFTLNNEALPIVNDLEISVFIPNEFSLYNTNNKYPKFPLKCIMHPPSPRGNNDMIYNSFMKPQRLLLNILSSDFEEIEDDDEPDEVLLEPVYGSKIGGNPAFLQNEILYVKNLHENEYVFTMQFDESSYLREQVIGNEPFNHGIVYFYGKFENELLVDFVAGFWQN